MRFFKIVFLSILCFFNHTLFTEIIPVKNLSLFNKETQKLTLNDLAVFDVDHTLIVYDDESLRPGGDEFRHQLLSTYISNSGKSKDYYKSIILENAPESLLDPQFKAIIDDLHTRNIPTIALTAVKPKSMGQIQDMVEWRIRHLKKLGIDFSKPHFTRMEFPQFRGRGPAPVFENGILFSGDYPKGEVLVAFLKRMNWFPHTVLFIDDCKSYIDTVERALTRFSTPCHLSFYYQAVDILPDQFDPKIAQFQFKKLIQEEQWISDREVKAMKN
jgi:Protein of unknown function (DUF2608)